jgi:hypothetical protein
MDPEIFHSLYTRSKNTPSFPRIFLPAGPPVRPLFADS